MASKPPMRFPVGKRSSLAVHGAAAAAQSRGALTTTIPEIDGDVRLMYLVHEGDIAGIRELVDAGTDVNYRDIDGRTPLHVAACEGFDDVVRLLLEKGARVDPEDQWGSTPLADALHYKNNEVIKLLEEHGAKLKITPMHVNNARLLLEYEIDPSELDFTNSKNITKGTFRVATWRGIQVAVKKLDDALITDEDKVRAFRDELALLLLIRHPNVVQFLGAVTQSSPMMIVTEFLPKGDLRAYLRRKGALKPTVAVALALDIARGMNYLHEHKPAIIHRDLEPSNILRDDSGHLKVADFDVSKSLKKTKKVREDRPLVCQGTACRYMAPELFRNEEYDTKVDVFSFALILQELIEGCPPFYHKQDSEVLEAYASKERPPFRAPLRKYSHGLKELIQQCWSQNPAERPSFREIIYRLTLIQNQTPKKKQWKSRDWSERSLVRMVVIDGVPPG
ncbi:Serine/threonine-protein kinase STY8 [Ananas comosus]|uniref:Serine/threonine-protein kinase STY8 n=1 Tax=Ananas comosus TaxID=4615 RepID=A0A199VNU1_ANACO|nr:Serine/threonine-protein kinase STY8 [Ananas comosus]